MASSATHQHPHADGAAGGLVPSPPPPTPSNQSLARSLSADTDAALSRFLHQLLLSPKTLSSLSPPTRRRSSLSSSSSSSPHLLSVQQLRLDQLPLRSAAADFGFFRLADHGVPSNIAAASLVEARSLITQHHPASNNNLSSLGFVNHDVDDGDEEHVDSGEIDRILALETDGNEDGNNFESLPALKEYGKLMERTGMELIEMLSSMEGGFPDNPFREGSNYKPRCLLWISSSKNSRSRTCNGVEEKEDDDDDETETEMKKSKCYPYVLGLHLMQELKQHPWCVLGDSGDWISVDPHGADTLLVTLGDIAQVWSNGRFKKVNGRPRPSTLSLDCCADDHDYSFISLSFFITLPLESVISPLLPLPAESSSHLSNVVNEAEEEKDDRKKKFHGFCLEEYAWRLYHECLPIKDPLLKYRN